MEEARAELHTLNTALHAVDHSMIGTVREQSLAANKQKGREQYFPVLWTLWLQGSADQSEVRLFLQKHYPNESPAQIEDRWNSLNSWASTASPEERQLRVDPGLATPMAHPVKNALRFLEETVIFEGVENVNLSTGMTPSGSCVRNFRCQHRGPLGVKYLRSPSTMKPMATTPACSMGYYTRHCSLS